MGGYRRAPFRWQPTLPKPDSDTSFTAAVARFYESNLDAAGFDRWTLTGRDDVSVATSADLPAIAYCQGTPLRNEIEARDPDGLERATAAAALALRERFGDGPIRGRISALIVTAPAPG